MEISADRVEVNLEDDGDCPISVYFYDSDKDYCFSLCRYSDAGMDAFEGHKIQVMVRDQVTADTNNLSVALHPESLVARFDAKTAAELLGVEEITVHFRADAELAGRIRSALRTMFRDLPGLTVPDG